MKTIRELSDMTPEELAADMGINVEEYLAYESGNADIPISVLYDISNTLAVSITELLTGESAKMHTYSVVRRGKGIKVERSSAYKYSDLAYNFVDRKVSPFLVTIAPSDDDEPYHLNVHSGHEYHYCLEGSFKIKIGNSIITINEGDSLYFDSGNPHGMKAQGGKNAVVLVVVI
ncbi:MAG: helix-turn-helix transcriptional regulator [Clostridiales bacterium]|nr:helix-turn-helix transcriptional regulator [Clostridiales bacterium]